MHACERVELCVVGVSQMRLPSLALVSLNCFPAASPPPVARGVSRGCPDVVQVCPEGVQVSRECPEGSQKLNRSEVDVKSK